MRLLELHSERYAATGNLASDGARNQLGRPRLDPLTVLIREAVQNSWDARENEAGGARFDLSLSQASERQLRALRDVVFAQRPPKIDLERVARGESIPLLMLSDRGTKGLGGPTRADVVVHPDEPHDFVDFLRNLGEAPDKPFGGGTFGYGKAALYAVSRARSILVHTRTRVGRKLESRFIGAGLGQSFVQGKPGVNGVRFTGRHWWGQLQGELAEPLRDREADEVAAALGMPGFTGTECGTTILIVDFHPTERTLEQAMQVMSHALLWNFWPKMVLLPDETLPMQFSARLHDREWHIPRPDEHAPLQLFADALRGARAKNVGKAPPDGVDVHEIWCLKPKVQLGWLALAKGFKSPRSGDTRIDEAAGGIVGPCCSHIAYMRSAELVVRYVEGPPLQSEILEYGAVFVAEAEPEVDKAFADSEPPTHDDWVLQQLQDHRQRTLVGMGLKRIKEKLASLATPFASVTEEMSSSALGRLSTMLGGLLSGLDGPGGAVAHTEENRRTRSAPVVEDFSDGDDEASGGEEPAPGEGSAAPGADPLPIGRPVRPGRPTVRVSSPRLIIEDGLGVFQLEVDVHTGKNTVGTTLHVEARAVLDGGAEETSPPIGAQTPQVYRWRGPDGTVLDDPGADLQLEPAQDGRWLLSVRLIDDAEVRVTVRGEPVVAP